MPGDPCRKPAAGRTSGSRTAHLPAEIGWSGWGELFTDTQTWMPVLDRIYRDQGFDRLKSVETPYPGTCAVFLVDRKTVIKLFPPFLTVDFRKEKEVYELIGGRIAAMPRLIDSGIYRDRLDWPYLILEFRPGQAMRELRGALGFGDKMMLASEIGSLIRRVHESPLTEFNSLDIRPQAWRRFLETRRAESRAELRDKASLSKRMLDEITAFLETADLTTPGFAPKLLNADVTADHLLLVKHEGTWCISALIDWADAEAGAPEYEWVAVWFELCGRDPDMFRQILHAYDPTLRFDQSLRLRLCAYTFLHRFGAEIIADALRHGGHPKSDSLVELQALLWSTW